MNVKFMLIGSMAVLVVFLSAQSAHAQWLRNRIAGRTINHQNVWAQPRNVTPKATARPVTGYGTNLHRNFVIRQEQQRTERTGIAPRPRGNILWAR